MDLVPDLRQPAFELGYVHARRPASSRKSEGEIR
jgi:hypothetical protein